MAKTYFTLEEANNLLKQIEPKARKLQNKYAKELDSGKIKWGSLHSATFWEDNYKSFEPNNFEYIEKLVKIVQNPMQIITEHEVEMKCIACFDLGEFARCYPGGSM